MGSSWMNDHLIDMYGQTITIYQYTQTVNSDGEVTDEVCSNTIECTGWVMTFGGLLEKYELYGYRIDGDYSICISNTITVSPKDKVVLGVDKTELEIIEVLKHYEFNEIAYQDIIARKEGVRR